MQTKTFKIKGMHCASCVSLIQDKLSKVSGVKSVSVGLSSEKVTLVFEDKEIDIKYLNEAIRQFGYSLETDQKVLGKHNHGNSEGDHESKESVSFEMMFVIPMVVISFFMMGWDALGKNGFVPLMSETVYEFFHHVMPIFASFVLFGIGRKYIKAVWIFLKTGTANMDTLVGISTIVAFLYSFVVTAFEKTLAPYLDVTSNFYDVVIVVIGLIALGQSLEERARRKTNEALQKLALLSSKSGIVERDGKEVLAPIEEIKIGEIVIVKPNEKIPVDGTIVYGASSIDESNLTGESVPVDKSVGTPVFAGTINFQGLLKIKVEKDNRDTALAHIMTIVENAQNSKAEIERVADKISGVFVYVVIILAAITFLLWMFFAPPTFGFGHAFALAISSTMAVLVIACPCSLGLATPTAIITGVGAGARRGILIKNAESLERLSKVNVIVFDKTGTLTENKLSVEGIFCHDKNHVCDKMESDFKRAIIFALTKSSRHPISQSVAEWLENHDTSHLQMQHIKEIPGNGVVGVFENKEYYLGSLSFAISTTGKKEEDIVKDFHDSRFDGGRELYLFDDKDVLSLIKVHDTVKADVKQEILKLKNLGLRVVMATGDKNKTGLSVARELGIFEVFTDVTPEDKLKIIKDFQSKGLKVAMIGDGVNDSPALAEADVAISMSDGSDIAIESSDIVLLNGNISKVRSAISLAKKTNRIIWQNLIWSFGYNSIGIPVAAGILVPFFGWTLSPAVAGSIMAFESITVVANSLRLKNFKL